MPYSDEPISIIENLDPEPSTKGGGRQWWEITLGLALLVAVLAFAGWQWLWQDAQQSSYAGGIAAAARHDWEAAQAQFSFASGYHDADKRAQQAADMISQRDSQYHIALTNR